MVIRRCFGINLEVNTLAWGPKLCFLTSMVPITLPPDTELFIIMWEAARVSMAAITSESELKRFSTIKAPHTILLQAIKHSIVMQEPSPTNYRRVTITLRWGINRFFILIPEGFLQQLFPLIILALVTRHSITIPRETGTLPLGINRGKNPQRVITTHLSGMVPMQARVPSITQRP